MASLRRRDQEPHFFKIIVADTGEIEMLKIPTRFTKMYGDSFSNRLCLRVPNGGLWRVDVVRNDGEVWLRGGWKEFAEHYSLEYGSLLVFRYHGDSNFWVFIFDMSASEISYPNIPGEESQLKENDCRRDLPIEILDEWSAHASPQKRKKMNSDNVPSASRFADNDANTNVLKLEKSVRGLDCSRHDLGVSAQEKESNATAEVSVELINLSEDSDLEVIDDGNDLRIDDLDEWSTHSLHHKSRKMNSSSETQNDANLLPSVSHFATTDTKSNVLNLEKSGIKSDRSRRDLGVSIRENGSNTMTTHNLSNETRALLRAEAFQSKHPSFRVKMQASYITWPRMTVPMKFAERFMVLKNGNVTLSVTDERTWSARYVWNVYKKTCVTIQCGWSAFVKDNGLKVGDVCVFELINRRKNLFRVVIFRDTSDATNPPSPDNEDILDRPRKRKMEQKVEPSEISIDSLDDLSPRQEGEVRGNQWTPEDAQSSGITKPREPAGRSNPSFKVVMLASYIRAKTLNVPGDIVEELTHKKPVTVMLKVADKLWPVNLIPYENCKSGKLSRGFSAFMKENALELGDECGFELIDKNGRIFNVTISRRVIRSE